MHTFNDIFVIGDNTFIEAGLVILIGVSFNAHTMATIVEEENIPRLRLADELFKSPKNGDPRGFRVVVIGVNEHFYVILRESILLH